MPTPRPNVGPVVVRPIVVDGHALVAGCRPLGKDAPGPMRGIVEATAVQQVTKETLWKITEPALMITVIILRAADALPGNNHSSLATKIFLTVKQSLTRPTGLCFVKVVKALTSSGWLPAPKMIVHKI